MQQQQRSSSAGPTTLWAWQNHVNRKCFAPAAALNPKQRFEGVAASEQQAQRNDETHGDTENSKGATSDLHQRRVGRKFLNCGAHPTQQRRDLSSVKERETVFRRSPERRRESCRVGGRRVKCWLNRARERMERSVSKLIDRQWAIWCQW